MTFKIILTVLLSLSLSSIYKVDKPRDPIGFGEWFIGVVISAVLVYGLWNWL